MPRQKLKPRPKVSAVGNFGRAPRPNPPNAPRPNCAAAVAATLKTRTAAIRPRSFMSVKSQTPDPKPQIQTRRCWELGFGIWDLGFGISPYFPPFESDLKYSSLAFLYASGDSSPPDSASAF